MKYQFLILVFTLAVLQDDGWLQTRAEANTQSVKRPAPPKSKKIKISGFVASCYKPHNWKVFITSDPSRKFQFESKTITVGADGNFIFMLGADEVSPGKYYLKFGKTKEGAGSFMFEINSETVDLGSVGDCDT
jgi:hypothetical protein